MFSKLSKKELRLYIASAVVFVVGLVFLIIGIIADHLPAKNPLYILQLKFHWRYIGLIIIAASIIFALIVLLYFARKVDRITDRELRRKQRLSAMMQGSEEEKIVVSDGKIVEKEKSSKEDEENIEMKAVEQNKPEETANISIDNEAK